MDDPRLDGAPLPSYRIAWLQLRRLLYDRSADLPALPVLFEDVRPALERGQRLGLLHVELDSLDAVESIYGGTVLERLVARLAGVLREAVGRELPGDTLLALDRVAGDRFVILVPPGAAGRMDLEQLGAFRRAVRARLERELDHDDLCDLVPRPRVRVGQSLLSAEPFRRLERSVYAAVEAARGAAARHESRRELAWCDELRAIIRRGGVEPVFQPVIELPGDTIVGYEALARGPRESLFEAPRTMFVLSERLGEATALDRLCLEAAVSAFARGVGRGRLFLNVLPASFDDGAFREGRLPALLGAAGLAPADIVFELSEREAARAPEALAACIARLREQGFAIALDDVGTGGVAHDFLVDLDVEFLKLDVSLVRNVDCNLIKQEVLRTVLALARRIGAEVIAEGVETEREAEALLDAGVRLAQGHRFAAAVAMGSLPAAGSGRRP